MNNNTHDLTQHDLTQVLLPGETLEQLNHLLNVLKGSNLTRYRVRYIFIEAGIRNGYRVVKKVPEQLSVTQQLVPFSETNIIIKDIKDNDGDQQELWDIGWVNPEERTREFIASLNR